MGFSVSWLATQDCAPEVLREQLGIGILDSGDEVPQSSDYIFTSGGGWVVAVFNSGCDAAEAWAERISKLGLDVITCSVEEHVMFSSVSLWKSGEQVWSVRHEPSNPNDLTLIDKPPQELTEAVDRVQRARAEAGPDGDEVDWGFEIPVELGKILVGYRHDEVLPAGLSHTVAAPTDSSPAPIGKRIVAKLIDFLLTGLTVYGFASVTGSYYIGLAVGYGWLAISDAWSPSPGKALFKLRVVSATTGKACTAWQSTVRNSPFLLLSLPPRIHREVLGLDSSAYNTEYPWLIGTMVALTLLWYFVARIRMKRDPMERRPADFLADTVVRRA